MVSGRHKAYEHAEPTDDSLSNETSATAYSLNLEINEAAIISDSYITVAGKRFSRKTLDRLVVKAMDKKRNFITLPGYNGEKPEPVEAHGKRYIALFKNTSRGGYMHFVVYDFSDGLVKKARTRFETIKHDQADPEEVNDENKYDDLIDTLEEEYYSR